MSTATTTTIDAGPDIYVSIGSKLVLTCRVYTAGIKLNYLIWRRGDKVKWDNVSIKFQTQRVFRLPNSLVERTLE